MNFLPQNYQAPKSSNGYMKLQEGENRIRILSTALLGWEDWDNKTPIRFKFDQKPNKPIDPKKPLKHFWAFIVWNYNEEQIQILHVTQATIRNKIQSLCEDQDWGFPYFYDIKIIKKGEGMETEYDINPLPHKDLNHSVIQAFHEKPCNLEALFTGEDPFDRSNKQFTQGVFKSHSSQIIVRPSAFQVKATESKKPSDEEFENLSSILAECDPEFVKAKLEGIKNLPGVKDLYNINLTTYTWLLDLAKKNKDKYIESLKENENLPNEAL